MLATYYRFWPWAKSGKNLRKTLLERYEITENGSRPKSVKALLV
jgi:hypothetical protein